MRYLLFHVIEGCIHRIILISTKQNDQLYSLPRKPIPDPQTAAEVRPLHVRGLYSIDSITPYDSVVVDIHTTPRYVLTLPDPDHLSITGDNQHFYWVLSGQCLGKYRTHVSEGQP